MKPYGMKKRGSKLHPHDECGICSAHPPTKGQARAAFKRDREIVEGLTEFDERYDEDWDQDYILERFFRQRIYGWRDD